MAQDTAAVVLAAGSGRRLGGVAKALLPLRERPLLAWCLAALRATPAIAQIVLVMRPQDEAELRERWNCDARALGADRVVAGGAERWLSSRAGAEAADPAHPLLLVLDAARPCIQSREIERVIEAVRAHGAALLAEPLTDTLKQADGAGRVARTLAREGLWRAQTPQGARRELLLRAFAAWDAASQGLPTDESALLEHAGIAPALVEARAPNPKLTFPADLAAAAALLAGFD